MHAHVNSGIISVKHIYSYAYILIVLFNSKHKKQFMSGKLHVMLYPVRPHTFVSPSADSRRAVVSYWRKYVHEVLVSRLGGLRLPRKSVLRLTDRPDMTSAFYRERKITTQKAVLHSAKNGRSFTHNMNFYSAVI